MADDLKGFARRMKVLGDLVTTNADKLTRRVALAVDGSVVIATPVATGRARSNWIVELGQAAEHVVPSGGTSGRSALDQGAETIARYQGGQAIHITNNLPYIGRLNDGWSAQAPSGFVEIAVQNGVAQIGDARVTVEGGVK